MRHGRNVLVAHRALKRALLCSFGISPRGRATGGLCLLRAPGMGVVFIAVTAQAYRFVGGGRSMLSAVSVSAAAAGKLRRCRGDKDAHMPAELGGEGRTTFDSRSVLHDKFAFACIKLPCPAPVMIEVNLIHMDFSAEKTVERGPDAAGMRLTATQKALHLARYAVSRFDAIPDRNPAAIIRTEKHAGKFAFRSGHRGYAVVMAERVLRDRLFPALIRTKSGEVPCAQRCYIPGLQMAAISATKYGRARAAECRRRMWSA